jgi:hypothetical protein
MNRIPKGESLMKSTKIKKRIAPENQGMNNKLQTKNTMIEKLFTLGYTTSGDP